jgi:RNA polymerase sigma factor (sigma-70 family)
MSRSPDLGSLKPRPSVARPLFERAAANSAEELASLAQLYRAYIQHWARTQIPQNMRPRIDSSSVAQETIVRVQAGTDKFAGRTLEEFENYLLTTAHNLLVDLRRFHLAKKRSRVLEQRLDALESRALWQSVLNAAAPGPDELVMAQDEIDVLRSRVQAALKKLPAHYEVVILEHFVHGKSYEEIAAALDRSPHAVRMLIARAVKALRKSLGVSEGGTYAE